MAQLLVMPQSEAVTSSPETPFEELEELFNNGWEFKGNEFQGGKTQKWSLIASRNGHRISIPSPRAYPKVVDCTGKLKDIP